MAKEQKFKVSELKNKHIVTKDHYEARIDEIKHKNMEISIGRLKLLFQSNKFNVFSKFVIKYGPVKPEKSLNRTNDLQFSSMADLTDFQSPRSESALNFTLVSQNN